MSTSARRWTARLLLATVFGMWAVEMSEHPALRTALVPELHASDHRDTTGSPLGQGMGDALAFTELEESDEDSAHQRLAFLISSPDASAEHAQRDDGLGQHRAQKPPTPPPKA